MKIMLSAGETSGDLHGAALARELRTLDPSVQLIGFGGTEMAAAGVTLRQNYADYNVMGISAVILNLRRIFALLDDLTHLMDEEHPDVLVIIDYPDFNWRLAARAKERGIPVFSYIPPSAWAWRKGRAKSCAALADEIVAIFPHELPPYEAAGANISFVGNPLVDTVRAEMPPTEARTMCRSCSSQAVAVRRLSGSFLPCWGRQSGSARQTLRAVSFFQLRAAWMRSVSERISPPPRRR